MCSESAQNVEEGVAEADGETEHGDDEKREFVR